MKGWERIKFVMENEGHNKNSFSKAIGMASNVTITRIINEERNPQRATYQRIMQKFPKYNPEWLLSGTGDIYNKPNRSKEDKKTTPEQEIVSTKEITVSTKEKNINHKHPNTRHSEHSGFIEIPLIHVQAQCGYMNGYANEDYIGALPTLPVIADGAYRGKYRLFEVKGDSMDNDSRNSICDGDIVLAREVQPDPRAHKLNIKDWFFVIVHRTHGISIKQITEYDAQQGTITCHPLNDMFSDDTIHLDDVVELYHLIKIVDRSARL